jgi:hypothetical protein
MIGSIEHELTEVMGRFARDGTTVGNSPPLYTIMDLFRYAAPGVRQTTNGDPAGARGRHGGLDQSRAGIGKSAASPSILRPAPWEVRTAQPLSSCRRWRALATIALGADTSQQTFLTTPQHV